MNDVFDNPEQELPQGEPTVPAELPEADGAATPAADTEKHVPLKALEAERSQRQDWKEKALRFEGELKAMREQRDRTQEPREVDPLQQAVAQAQNERLDTSEMLAREKFGDKAVDEAFAKFQEAVGKDPTLFQRVMSQKHPWGFVVKEMQKAALLEEIGDDPVAWKERLRAEAASPPPAAQRPPLPKSLASASSAGARGSAWTGPPPMDDIFN